MVSGNGNSALVIVAQVLWIQEVEMVTKQCLYIFIYLSICYNECMLEIKVLLQRDI